jgi:hypothetical protein
MHGLSPLSLHPSIPIEHVGRCWIRMSRVREPRSNDVSWTQHWSIAKNVHEHLFVPVVVAVTFDQPTVVGCNNPNCVVLVSTMEWRRV